MSNNRGLNYYKFGAYMEQIKDRAKDRGASAPPEAFGLEDRNAQECMLMLLQNYPYWRSEMPNDPTESKIYEDMIYYSKAPATQRRVRNENHAEISFMSGLEKVDALESTGFSELKKHLIQPAQVFYIYGFMGEGKTMLAETMGEIFEDEFEKAEVATNLETLDPFRTINQFGELKDWLNADSDASNEEEKLFVFDEAGSHATSLTGKQQAQTYNMLLPVIKQIRKARGRIILIGQSGMDLAKDIRRLALSIEKTGEKTATIYDRGEDGSKLFDLYNIPQPSESYRHDTEREEFAEWSWETEDEDRWFENLNSDEKDKIVNELYNDGLTMQDIADSDVIAWLNSKGSVSKVID